MRRLSVSNSLLNRYFQFKRLSPCHCRFVSPLSVRTHDITALTTHITAVLIIKKKKKLRTSLIEFYKSTYILLLYPSEMVYTRYLTRENIARSIFYRMIIHSQSHLRIVLFGIEKIMTYIFINECLNLFVRCHT